MAVTAPKTPTYRTGAVIAGVAAIPFASVTFACLAADVGTASGSSTGAGGLVALGAGLVMGLLTLRVIGGIREGLGIARVALERIADEIVLDILWLESRAPMPFRRPRPSMAFVPAEVGRRGPPTRIN